jgi:cytochrome P450
VALVPILSFLRYIRKLVRVRRAAPGNDLMSALVQAQEAGDKLSEDELLTMIFLLIVAGYETTVNLISSGTLALLQNPGELSRLRDDPSLIGDAVEELLRYTNPAGTTMERYARETLTIGDATIPQGAPIILAIAAANWDERHFHNPEQLELSRSPKKHLAFGWGARFCIGAPLARLEAQIAINTLLRRCSELRLAKPNSVPSWRPGLEMNGLTALNVVW